MTTQNDIAELKRQMESLTVLCVEQKQRITALERLDQSRLRAAVIGLGALVLSLISFIYLSDKGA